MKLSELCFHIHPKTGALVPTASGNAQLPYVTFERRPLSPGEQYLVRHPGGNLTSELQPFPADQTHKIVYVLHHADGSVEENLHYAGPAGEPVDTLPGVENA